MAKYCNLAHFKRFTFYLHLSASPCVAYHFPLWPPYFRHDDADARGGPLYDLKIARSRRCKDDASLRKNRQSQERRSGQSRERIVQLEPRKNGFKKSLVYMGGHI